MRTWTFLHCNLLFIKIIFQDFYFSDGRLHSERLRKRRPCPPTETSPSGSRDVRGALLLSLPETLVLCRCSPCGRSTVRSKCVSDSAPLFFFSNWFLRSCHLVVPGFRFHKTLRRYALNSNYPPFVLVLASVISNAKVTIRDFYWFDLQL